MQPQMQPEVDMYILYRVRQWILSIGIRVLSKDVKEVISGKGALLQIPDKIVASGHKNVLLVTTNGFIKRKTLEPFMEAMKSKGLSYFVYSDVTPDPTVACVEDGLKVYLENQCEVIVAVGGGSVMDAAKIIGARAVCPKKSIQKMRGVFKVMKKQPDFYAVPTTAGTGSETTAAAVITDTIDGRHYKYAINDFCLIPKYAVLDPTLSVGLSPFMTATTGMDALTHALEAYTNKFASRKVKETARKAVCLIMNYLSEAYKDGTNLEARNNMLNGSFYAGIAFTNNFVGYVHAIAHGVGALYGVSHGEANAVILTHVLRAYGEAVYKPLSELALLVGIEGADDKERATRLIDRIDEMNRSFGISEKINDLKSEDYDILIERAMKEANPLYPVPVIWGKDEFKAILQQLS